MLTVVFIQTAGFVDCFSDRVVSIDGSTAHPQRLVLRVVDLVQFLTRDKVVLPRVTGRTVNPFRLKVSPLPPMTTLPGLKLEVDTVTYYILLHQTRFRTETESARTQVGSVWTAPSTKNSCICGVPANDSSLI